MLNSIIEYSIKNKIIIGLCVIFLVCVGSYQASKLPIDAVPDITNNQVQVITIAPSFGAADIERLITFPIEQSCSNIPGTKEMRSFSRFGLSLVTIVFHDKINEYWARQQVSERLRQAQSFIPTGMGNPELGPITTGLGEIYQYVVRPKKGYEHKYDLTELRSIQDWIVRRQLMGVPGVAEVSSFGGKLKQIEINVNLNKLHEYGISIKEIIQAIESNNQNTGGAYIEKGPSVLYIRTEGLVKSVDDIKNISISHPNSNLPLFIRDIAEVNIGYATRYGALCYNDIGEVSGGIVMMLKAANSSEVIRMVKERIQKIEKNLPEGVIIEPFLDRSKMVHNAIGTVQKNLLEGALIVVFVLVLFLGNIRAGLLVASIIPLAMLFAICLMNLFGVSGNLMSLGAIDFGLIVDGAVIIVESAMHHLSHNRKIHNLLVMNQTQMDSTVNLSAKKMMKSAVFGQIIILIVYLPIFTLNGIEGKMFKPMAQTVAFALTGAFLLSITYIPMMSALILSHKMQSKETFSDRMMYRIERIYANSLLKALRMPKLIMAFVIIIFVACLFILSKLGGEFIPELEEGDFAVDTRVLTGSNLNTTIEFTQKAARLLLSKFPEVEKIVTKIGSGEVPTDPMPLEASDMMVILKDKNEWTSAKSFNELESKMSKALEVLPGVTAGFQFPVQMRFNELMTGSRQDVVCKIFGENLDSLTKYANELGRIANSIHGAQNIYVEPLSGIPQLVIQYNRQMIARFRLNIQDVNNIINAACAGKVVGQLYEDERRINVIVKMDQTLKKNINDIKNIMIPSEGGIQIPLYQIATIEIKNGINQIQREDAKRRIIVGLNVFGRDIQSVVNDLQQVVNNKLKLSPGYFIEYGGSFKNLEEAKSRLKIAVPVSLVMIFIILFFTFNNIKNGLLIYTAIPLSAIGGILLLAWRGMPFSISAGIGFIALFGVAVLNGIVLITEFNRLKELGIKSIYRIVIKGTLIRLRPVLMTAMVASLGFLPMAISNGPGAEVQKPIATVVIGGLLVATFLTLFILPLLYVFLGSFTFPKKAMSLGMLGIIFSVQILSAQGKIQLKSAIDSALINNLSIKSIRLKQEENKALLGTAKNIPKTSITIDWGQQNSSFFDTKLSFNQTASLPSVYKKQKILLESEFIQSSLLGKLTEFQIRRAVSFQYLEFVTLKSKEKLLGYADSLFSKYIEIARSRNEKGESNSLELATSESAGTHIKVRLLDLRSLLHVIELQFNFLIHCTNNYTPDLNYGEIFRIPFDSTSDPDPFLEIKYQEILLSKTKTEMAKAMLMPEISFGISNSSIRGIGADNKNYTAKDRFTTIQTGVMIPFFNQSIRHRIRAFQKAEIVAQNEAEMAAERFSLERIKLMEQYRATEKIIQILERNSRQNSQSIIQLSSLQFYKGEINYLDMVHLINKSVEIETEYIDYIYKLNSIALEYKYLSSK